jgi:hypothetical protein
MHYFTPSRASRTSYAQTRRDTLNFEACGAEASVDEISTPVTLAPVIAFPTATRSWITVNIHRKDSTMTSSHHETDGTVGERSGASDPHLERRLSFAATSPLHALVATHSGDVVVRATDSNDVLVTLRASSPKYSYLLETADVIFDAPNNTLTIRTLPTGLSASKRGLRVGPARSWFDFGASDVDVVVEVPRGTSLDVTTVSGDTSLFGPLGVVGVKSVSGDVIARDTSDALEVQTASGDVKSGHVLTTLKCKSASGNVVCQGAAAHTEIYSASGDVLLSADQPGSIVVRNVSGDVIVRVARGLAVDISGNTVSGSMGTDIDLEGDGDVASDEETIVIKVTTVSGDIRIDKAS